MENFLEEPDNSIFGGRFNDWRKTRVKKIEDIIGKDWFNGKHILECGAGFGNVGLYLKSLGATVTLTDARNECLEEIKKKDPQVITIALDHDTKWNITLKFDMIIHFGLSYNLKNWQQDLACTIKQTKKYVIFETAVNRFKDDICFEINGYNPHHEYHGPANLIGSLPSVSLIEKELDNNEVTYKRYDDANLNIHNFKYDIPCDKDFVYPRNENGDVLNQPYIVDGWDNNYVSGGRKFWIIEK